MRFLTIGDTKLVLRSLLTTRLEDLRASATGRLYEPRLRAKMEALEGIPEASPRSPFAQELSEADMGHDGWGAAVHYACLAIAAAPGVRPEIKQAAEEALGTFIPQLGQLREPFADEAARAMSNRPKLAKQKAALKTVQVPGGGSLFEWVKSFLDAGDSIDSLLRRRAETMAASEDSAGNAALRASAIGLLTRFREALRDEIAEDGKLPADHEASLFAYFDKLAADRTAKAGRDSAEPEPEAPASPVVSPVVATPESQSPVAPA